MPGVGRRFVQTHKYLAVVLVLSADLDQPDQRFSISFQRFRSEPELTFFYDVSLITLQEIV